MAVSSAVNKIPTVETQTASLARNAATQVTQAQKRLTPTSTAFQQSKINGVAARIGSPINPYLTQADLLDALSKGEINQQEYDNYINEWRANGLPTNINQAQNRLGRTGAVETMSKPAAESASKAGIVKDNNNNAWVAQVDAAVDKVKSAVSSTVQSAVSAVQSWAEPLGKGSLNPTTPVAVWGSQQAGAGGGSNAEKVSALNDTIGDAIKGDVETVTGDTAALKSAATELNSQAGSAIMSGVAKFDSWADSFDNAVNNTLYNVAESAVSVMKSGVGIAQDVGQNLTDTLGRGPLNPTTPIGVQEEQRASMGGTSNAEKVDNLNDAISDAVPSGLFTLGQGGPLSVTTPISAWEAQTARDGGNSNVDKVRNIAAQTGRILPAAEKSTVNAIAGTAAIVNDGLKEAGVNTGQGSLNPASTPMAAYAKNQYDETGMSSLDVVGIKDMAAQAKAPIDTWVSENIPEPETQLAEVVATFSETMGGSLPAVAVATATGGTGAALIGNLASYGVGGMVAAGTEKLEGSGDNLTAITKGITSAASEYIGGKLFTGESLVGRTLGEGAEGVIDGGLFSLLTGESYTASEAATDFLYSSLAGLAYSGAADAINVVGKEIGTQKTVSDIKAGKGDGSVNGLSQSLDIAQANPEVYGGTARALATPAIESTFDTAKFRNYVESAVSEAQAKAIESGSTAPATVEVPSNIDNIDVRNIGGYHTLYDASASDSFWGMKNAASILEAAQVGKGLSPNQSGEILKATLQTNSDLYAKLGQVEGGSIDSSNTVQIELGADYRSELPTTGVADNYTVTEIQGRPAQVSESDVPVNAFRAISSEWVLPTLTSGEFAVPNATPMALDTASVFPTGSGQMLGAGLYTTSIPSKADQYGSGVTNDISIKGSDSKGIMAYSPIIGGETYINEAALNDAKRGTQNDTVRMGRSGQEIELRDFINSSQGNSEAAVIYSKQGNDYTEIVRPDALKTQIKNLYMPLAAIQETVGVQSSAELGVNQSEAESSQAPAHTAKAQSSVDADQSAPSAAESGQAQADAASIENSNMAGNADVNALLEKNIPADISLKPAINMPPDDGDGREPEPEPESEPEAVANVALEAVVDSFTDAVDGRISSEINTAPDTATIANEASEGTTETANSTSAVIASTASTPEAAAESDASTSGSILPEIALMSISETSGDGATTSDGASDNAQSDPEVKEAAVDTPVDINTSVAEMSSAQVEEIPIEITSEAKSIPISTTQEKTQSSDEPAGEELSSEERASEIWTPAQFMADKATEENRRKRKERELSTNDFSITKGPGSRGLIDETSGYKTTFGGLSTF